MNYLSACKIGVISSSVVLVNDEQMLGLWQYSENTKHIVEIKMIHKSQVIAKHVGLLISYCIYCNYSI